MREIDGKAKNVRTLLGSAKFSIDYYQREYRWEPKQITDLIEDLAQKFLESHKPGNERVAVERYGHYFHGSIIINDKEGQRFVIDGQQRLTSLTLLLIFIYCNLQDDKQKAQISDLIFSQKYGQRSFNIDVPERAACMEALFTDTYYKTDKESESVLNILDRYQDLKDNFPDEINGETLPYFADWLIENVHFVEITAYSEADAYTIFETMNDRGPSLTPTDMLKGYLLAHISDGEMRDRVSGIWRERISSLQELGKDEDADAIKAWLRSQHAQTIRERKRGAQPRDFDLIGTKYHRWVRDHEDFLGLNKSVSFAALIQEDFSFYAKWYERLRRAGSELTEGLEAVHFNAQNNFTLQYTVLLAPLRRQDTETDILHKIRVVSTYLDILITRRIWNMRATDYSTMQYAMFVTMRDIRGKSPSELAIFLTKQLNDDGESFAKNDRFHLHGMNKKQIHLLLARITDYVETRSGRASRYREYVCRSGKNAYEVEHIWADHPNRHADEFAHPNDFTEYRNHIGGLLLLPKSFNASYGDKAYAEKWDHYYGQNLLAQSLHEKAYSHDPGFRRFIDHSKLAFKPHLEFKKQDLDMRQALYLDLVEQIWDVNLLTHYVEARPAL